jgi:hypothetical protein
MANKKKIDRQEFWIIVVMAVLFAIVIGFYLFLTNMKSFTYEGLEFQKEKYGKLDLYHYTYHFTTNTGKLITYNLYLKNDPRKNDIPYRGYVSFEEGNLHYISLNLTALNNCSDSNIAVSTLSSFLADNQIKIKGAVLEQNQTVGRNTTYATCENKNDTSFGVIEFNSGKESSVKVNGKCYQLTFADCKDLTLVVEKFQIRAILDAKNESGTGFFE